MDNPLFSWINELARKATVAVFGALGTDKITLEEFKVVSKQYENETGSLTSDQWGKVADETGKKISNFFTALKWILPVVLVIAGIWAVDKLTKR